MNKQITSCLWFDGQAKEAAEFYCSIFMDSKITSENPVVTTFKAFDYNFTCLNGGPQFKCNPSISFFVVFESHEEVQEAWKKLSTEGNILMPFDKYPWSEKYGWVQDKYGVSWQLSYGKYKYVGQVVTPCLMFVGNKYGRAKEAINHYTRIFPNSFIDGILEYGMDEAPDIEGAVKHSQFSLDGTKFMVMESKHQHNFDFNEAISLIITCKDQNEIDYYWNKLTEGGEESMCGWLKDMFGVSWQVIPEILPALLSDPEKAGKATEAFLKMKKFDVKKLVEAAE